MNADVVCLNGLLSNGCQSFSLIMTLAIQMLYYIIVPIPVNN